MMKIHYKQFICQFLKGINRPNGAVSALALAGVFMACTPAKTPDQATDRQEIEKVVSTSDQGIATPSEWPALNTPPLDPAVEARVAEILAKLTLEQKVGQVIQADSGSVTPEEVKQYRLGSVLSGGNSAPGPLPYSDVQSWLAAVDAMYMASIDAEGVEIAVPIIWGIDAVHGHNNVIGGTIFPHNIGLGAANNPELIEKIAQITAKELSITGHDWTFAPTLAVPQNDRWGRTYEGFSESPDIVRAYGGRIVHGLQGYAGTESFMGDGRVISTAKHFIADGGTQNGIDQGDSLISEAELRDIHGAGYMTAIEAGAQSVMASYSAWHGTRMHGHKVLLTDVLKDQMNFNGFVVGDWNGHALIEGCTATDCPEAINAGIDMYMAPDSWKGLWESTLAHVKSGEIPMQRLNDAVTRILRAKVASGVFEKGRPRDRAFAGDLDSLGQAEHRAIARQAARESLVLLKNNDGLLPLEAGQTILVVGNGADSIAKTAGGWTLSWQGGGDLTNDLFPNGETVLSGIRKVVEAGGGQVVFAPDGQSDMDADIVIAVYGEDPYAEFLGDRDHLDFMPKGFDPQILKQHGERGAKIVSVFLSGRPLWTNPEMNLSDAFVAAWLPGSEGGAISDLLFQSEPSFDFKGRLSFSWPKRASQDVLNSTSPDYDPLFPIGYGMSYADRNTLDLLSEDMSDIADLQGPNYVFFEKGKAVEPWTLNIKGESISGLLFSNADIALSAIDKESQEDSVKIEYRSPNAEISLSSAMPQDLARQSNGAMEIVFDAKSLAGSGRHEFGVGCVSEGSEPCKAFVPIQLEKDWQTYRLSLSCFAEQGVNMGTLNDILILRGETGQSLALTDLRLAEDLDAAQDC